MLTRDRATAFKPDEFFQLPVAAGKKIFGGALVCLDADGNATPGAAATGLRGAGRCEAFADNSAGGAGAIRVQLRRGIFRWNNSGGGDAIASSMIGSLCYVIDDQTVAATDGSGTRSPAGVVADVDSVGVWVSMDVHGPLASSGGGGGGISNPITYTGDPTGLSISYSLGGFSAGALAAAGLIAADSTTSANGLLTIDYGAIAAFSGDFSPTMSALTSLSLPALTTISGDFSPTMSALTSLSLPALTTISGDFSPTMSALTSLSLPALTTISGAFSPTMSALTSLSLPALTTISGAFSPTMSALTTSLSLNSLTAINATFSLTLNALTSLSLNSLTAMNGSFSPTMNALTSLSLDSLETVSGEFAPTMNALTSLSLSSLTTISGSFVTTMSALTSLSLDSLATVSGAFEPTLDALTSLSLPAFTSGGFYPNVDSCTSMSLPLWHDDGAGEGFGFSTAATAINFPSLVDVTGGWYENGGAGYASVLTFDFPAIVTLAGGVVIGTATSCTALNLGSGLQSAGTNTDFKFQNAALTQASVDDILMKLAALDGTGGTTIFQNQTVNLSGGTSASPGASGITAAATLTGRGCTVVTN